MKQRFPFLRICKLNLPIILKDKRLLATQSTFALESVHVVLLNINFVNS